MNLPPVEPVPSGDPEPRTGPYERRWRVLDDAAWLAWFTGDASYQGARRAAEAAFDEMRENER